MVYNRLRMSDQLVSFENEVSATGYRVVHAHAGHSYESARGRGLVDIKDRVLIAAADDYGDTEFERRRPLQDTGLFRTFAALNCTDGSIKEFANQWGTLTNGVIQVHDYEHESDEDLEYQGEPLNCWIIEIRKLRILLALWDATREGRNGDIDKVLESSPAGVRFKDPDSPFGPETLPISRPDFVWDTPASYELGRSMARGGLHSTARSRARAVVSTLVNRELGLGAAVRLGVSPERKNDLEMRLVPRDLRAALWLQFARSISATKKYHQCEECTRFFEVESSEGARADSRFCSTACRARNWRRKKAAGIKNE
jgi:hypothetical protein